MDLGRPHRPWGLNRVAASRRSLSDQVSAAIISPQDNILLPQPIIHRPGYDGVPTGFAGKEGNLGAWGTALFADDVACDVRDAYRQLVAEGSSGPAATVQLLREWQEVIADEEEGPVFWLALAATQWECGRFEVEVKAKALAILDDGSALAAWTEGDDSGLLRKRQAALEKLRAQFKSAPPAVKQIRRRLVADACPWALGQVLAYQLPSGNQVLFHLVGKHESGAGPLPIFAILDWVGKELPPAPWLRSLPVKLFPGGTAPYLFSPLRRSKKDFSAEWLIPLEIRRKPPRRKIDGGFTMFFWKDLPTVLKQQFELK